MRAADVMTRRLVTVAPEATVADAVRLMLQHGVSGLPVVDAAGTLAGIVSEGDLLRRSETGTERRRPRWLEFFTSPARLAEEYVRSHGRRIAEVMTRDVATVAPETPLAELVTVLERRRIKRVPVVDAGRLVGIVSRSNLLHALAGLLPGAAPAAASDLQIRRAVLHAVEAQPWAPAALDVTVRGGVVELWGMIYDQRQRQALQVAVENVDGVKGLHDHLSYVDPASRIVVD